MCTKSVLHPEYRGVSRGRGLELGRAWHVRASSAGVVGSRDEAGSGKSGGLVGESGWVVASR